MDRRRFLRAAGLGLVILPASRFLAACANEAKTSSSTSQATTLMPTTASSTALPPTAADQPPATDAPAEAAAPASIEAICRDAWGANPVGEGLEAHTIERLTVHHTAALLDDNRRAPARLRSHQMFHQSKGWPDIAYHYAVDGNGNVYEGRPTDYRGDTGTNYNPTGHFLVVAEGNFDSQDIPAAQVAGVAAVLAWAATRFGVSPETIRGHRDWASTSCPGASFYPLVADGSLRAATDALLAAGGVELDVVCGDAAVARVAAIEAGTEPPATEAGFFLRNSNTQGPADTEFRFGEPGWIPVSGDFGFGE